MKNYACFTLFFITTLSFLSAQQETPPTVKFNHLYFVIEARDLKAIKKSDYVKNKLVAFESRETKADSTDAWVGNFFYGEDSYIELFDTFGIKAPLGISGIALNTEKNETFTELQVFLNKHYQTRGFNREHDVAGKKTPWFSGVYLADSLFNEKSHFNFWMMQYQSEFFEQKKLPMEEKKLTTVNYLKSFDTLRENKLLKRFSGVVMTLNAIEKKTLTDYFECMQFTKISDNQYRAPNYFTFTLKNRPAHSSQTIEAIEFETTTIVKRQTVKISNNVSVNLNWNKGAFVFGKVS